MSGSGAVRDGGLVFFSSFWREIPTLADLARTELVDLKRQVGASLEMRSCPESDDVDDVGCVDLWHGAA